MLQEGFGMWGWGRVSGDGLEPSGREDVPWEEDLSWKDDLPGKEVLSWNEDLPWNEDLSQKGGESS